MATPARQDGNVLEQEEGQHILPEQLKHKVSHSTRLFRSSKVLLGETLTHLQG